jgi:hypothetical protein
MTDGQSALIEFTMLTMFKGSTTAFHECVASETCMNGCLAK